VIEVVEPSAKPELIRELHSVHKQGTEFWSAFDTAEFFAPIGEAWSPADNVRHLLKSNRPVARALEVPRLGLVFRFGLTRRPSRTYEAMRETYLKALAGGVTAGRFAPTPEPPPADLEAARRELMEKREMVSARLLAALTRWSEWSLDHLVMPHPALGKLTAREMLFFTIYHNTHHVQNVARRKGMGPAEVIR
jgi:DinB family protein